MASLAKPQHEITYQELAAFIGKKAGDDVSALEVLAIASNMVGKLIAMQDQRHVSKDRAMRIVATNMELGNQQAVDALKDSKGSA